MYRNACMTTTIMNCRMIILDDQAHQQISSCMPDEARDGRNVALK